MYAQRFQDLMVYQDTRNVAKCIFEISKQFPPEERYSLTDQVRRSSRSIGGQIAEAWAKRAYPNHFKSKLTDADGEQRETQHWVETAMDCQYVSVDEGARVLTSLENIGKKLQRMIDKADQFCNSSNLMHEDDSVEYLVNGEQ